MREGQPNPCSKAALDTIDEAMREKWWTLHRDNNVTVKGIATRFGLNYYTVARYLAARKKQAAG